MPDAHGNFKGLALGDRGRESWDRIFGGWCSCPLVTPGRCRQGSPCEATCHAVARMNSPVSPPRPDWLAEDGSDARD